MLLPFPANELKSSEMSDASEWVAVNLQGQVGAGGSMAPCQVVTLSTSGLVLLPQMKGTAGMALVVELQEHHWPQAIQLPGVLMREGEYHGHYAWQVQFSELPPPAQRGLMELLGMAPPPEEEQPEPEPFQDRGAKRSYSHVFADLPDLEGVSEVDETPFEEESGVLPRPKDRDLLKSVDKDSVKKIYKEALQQLDADKSKDKKKKGWFR